MKSLLKINKYYKNKELQQANAIYNIEKNIYAIDTFVYRTLLIANRYDR